MRHPFYEYLFRKGWTYNQLETLWAHNRRQNLWALIMISLGGVMFWYSHHDVKPELPQVIHFPNHYVAEETVDKKDRWQDARGDQRYQCILSGHLAETDQWINWDVTVIEFQEDSDPLLGYLREMGMIINQAQFQANQANSYLDQRPGLEMLNAGQWNCDRAYLDTSEQRRNSVYLLSENRVIVFRFTPSMELSAELMKQLSAVFTRTDLFKS